MSQSPQQYTWHFGQNTYADFESFLAAFTDYNHRILGIEPPIDDFPVSNSPSVYLLFVSDHDIYRALVTSRTSDSLSFLEMMFLANEMLHPLLHDSTNGYFGGLSKIDDAEEIPSFELQLGFEEGCRAFVASDSGDELLGDDIYEHRVPYEADIQSALDKLRAKVFESGDFNGAQFEPSTPEEAFDLAEEVGTRSILDIPRIANHPDYCCAAPLSPQELQHFFGTERPTQEDLKRATNFGEDIERGQCRYVVLYDANEPKQIYFIGVSFD